MADLDHFKKVNDAFGHLAGDDALRVFGDLIRTSFRASDICCQYGGEEFVIILPELPLEDSYQRTDELRKTLAETEIASGPARLHLTATFGVALFPNDGDTREELLAAADQALYRGKQAGRNRVNRYCADHLKVTA